VEIIVSFFLAASLSCGSLRRREYLCALSKNLLNGSRTYGDRLQADRSIARICHVDTVLAHGAIGVERRQEGRIIVHRLR